jgi:hypothetical protein
MNSRDKVIAKIAMMEEKLHCQKIQIIEAKHYFANHGITRNHLMSVGLIVSSFYVGWTLNRKQWGSKIIKSLTEIGTVTFISYFKRSLLALL